MSYLRLVFLEAESSTTMGSMAAARARPRETPQVTGVAAASGVALGAGGGGSGQDVVNRNRVTHFWETVKQAE